MSARDAILAAALLCTCLALVYVRAESRVAYAELHRLERDRDDLDVEYGRLLIERATWSLHHQVEKEAADRLDMRRPGADDVVTLLVGASP